MSANSDFVSCVTCPTMYHVSCSKKARKNSAGSYEKCCSSAPMTKNEFAVELATQMDTLREDLKKVITESISESLLKVSERLDTVEANVSELSEKVASLEGRHSTGSDPVGTEELLAEMADRERRACNVIVFGVAPDESKDDIEVNNDIFRSIPDLPIAIRAQRLAGGRSNIKPVKVSFVNKSDALCVLRNKANLSRLNIVVKNDITPLQKEHIRRLNSELQRRIQGGGKKFANQIF